MYRIVCHEAQVCQRMIQNLLETTSVHQNSGQTHDSYQVLSLKGIIWWVIANYQLLHVHQTCLEPTAFTHYWEWALLPLYGSGHIKETLHYKSIVKKPTVNQPEFYDMTTGCSKFPFRQLQESTEAKPISLSSYNLWRKGTCFWNWIPCLLCYQCDIQNVHIMPVYKKQLSNSLPMK